MKSSPSAGFTAIEEGTEIKPAELFHIWRGTTSWRYASGLKAITYDGNTYVPAPLERDAIQHDSDISADTMSFNCARVMPPIPEYIDMNPIDSLWVTVFHVHWDQSPIEAMPIFTGLIKSISFQGAAARVECVSLEYFLHRSVPRYRYQPGCNHTIYSSGRCKVVEASYSTTAIVDSISTNKFVLTLSGVTFESNAEPYYRFGYLHFGDHQRMIVDHVGLTVTMRYAITSLQAGDTVTVSAGCDKNIQTCLNKFSNVDNYFGFPYIAFANPVLRSYSKSVY